MTNNQEPVLSDVSAYLWIALRIAVLIAVAEIPILALNVIPPVIVFIAGWVVICSYTFYRVWRLNTQSLVVSDAGFAKLIACAFLAWLSVVFLLDVVIANSLTPASEDVIWRVKGAFVSNALVAVDAGALSVLGGIVVEKVRQYCAGLRARG
ncbi:hypothetical protein JQ616_18050 [Bradyrhizobium tropiciagri]|uniref:hypothetical protein n=1 Tax=Bradyrhizobium tropiciagri TaxID=312253 RepID=UPI001BA9EBB3|nr:hypothetical protein [Bradyrhizobium tropiciagri]MBR0896867.1 hypothetical protein [Bradyrhizobium tropiciagri]